VFCFLFVPKTKCINIQWIEEKHDHVNIQTDCNGSTVTVVCMRTSGDVLLFHILCLWGEILWHVVIYHLQITVCHGEKGLWNAAFIFVTSSLLLLLILNWCPFMYTGSLFASKYSEYENQQLCSSDTEDLKSLRCDTLSFGVQLLMLWRHYSPHVSTNTAARFGDLSPKYSRYWNSLKWDLTINFGLYHEALWAWGGVVVKALRY
jgi:hypothetical protein